ncbi:hypothetical protein OIO90_000802 [Microbotryomycetes sp. JL221]|nr:hypothetical protein OIO90_000802 [Microbotryomycetes sp. JL221]
MAAIETPLSTNRLDEAFGMTMEQQRQSSVPSTKIDAALADEERRLTRDRRDGRILDLLLLEASDPGFRTADILKSSSHTKLSTSFAGLDAEREAVRLIVMLSICSTVRKLLSLVEEAITEDDIVGSIDDPSTKQTWIEHLRNDLQPVVALEWPLRDAIGAINSGPSAQSISRVAAVPVDNQELKYGDPEQICTSRTASSSNAGDSTHDQKRRPSAQSFESEPFISTSFIDTLGSVACGLGTDLKQTFVATTNSNDSHLSFETNSKNRNWTAEGFFYANSQDPIHIISKNRPKIESLWNEAINKGLIAEEGPEQIQQGGLNISDSIRYFFNSLPRIATPVWLPEDQDMLNVRVRTVGIETHCLQVAPNRIIRVSDPAGARGTRHAWAPFFDHAAAIIFLFDTSTYNVCRQSKPTENRLNDAFTLFEEIIITFLNKIDLTKKRVQDDRWPFSRYFTQFKGNNHNVSEVLKFIQTKVEQKHNKIRKKTLYIFATQVNNSNSTQIVVAAVNDILTRSSLSASGLIL